MKSYFNRYKVITFLLYIIPLLIIIGMLLVSMRMNTDEPFTLNLIHHSYGQIINIDTFDVHPPFYYLILKLFLQITTFWTTSIIIKILFARAFSLLIFIVTFYFLLQILSLCDIDINWKIQLALYLVFPAILQYSIIIRMYQLATMFIVLEIYGLLLFRYKNSNKGLILVGISLILVIYTNYFAAAFAGAILFVEFIRYCISHNLRKAINTLLAGIISFVLFIPYSPIVIHQVRYVSSNSYSNVTGKSAKNGTSGIISQLLGAFTGKPISSISSEIFCFIFLIIEIILTIQVLKRFNTKYKVLFIELISSFILGFLPSIILSLMTHPMIEWRYGFPMFAIIYFVLISVITNDIDNSNVNKLGLYIIMASFCLVLLYSASVDKSNLNNALGTISVERNIHNNIHNNNREINMNGAYNSINTGKISASSVFLLNSNKKITAKHVLVSESLATNNRSLFSKVFSNVSLRGKSK